MHSIYEFIIEERIRYTKEIELADGWRWNMNDHLRRSFLYKNSQFEDQNENRKLRPNKNIVLAILNVHYRTEGFDVKDIKLFVDDVEEYYKSFLVKKFHDDWALENSIDTFIDEMVESYCDYGGALVRKTGKSRPEVVDLRSIAFCNQTNLLDNPFGIRHTFSPAQLRIAGKELGWGKDENGATIDIETFIQLKEQEGDASGSSGDGIQGEGTNYLNKNINNELEIFEVHGELPADWIIDNTDEQHSDKDAPQVQIVGFYRDIEGQEQGITLFNSKEPKLPFKLLKRDDIYDRALGRGGVEELFEAQAWTNFNEIKATEMLDAASKIIQVTDDPSFASKHPSGLKDIENLEVLDIGEGKEIKTLDNTPRNLPMFNDAIERWNNHAQIVGSAQDPLLGETPPSGTPFKLFEAQQIESKGIHKYRQGKIATFMDEIYRDWILPFIQKEIVKGKSFLAELSADEMQEVSINLTVNRVNEEIVEKILDGQVLTREEVDEMKSRIQNDFLTSGNNQFMTILKDEMKKPFGVKTNIAGRQKNLAALTDKLVNVLRQFISTPEIRQDPGMNKLLNMILESSDLSPIMFSPVPVNPQVVPQQEQGGTTEPLQDLAQANESTV
ncbi:MAG: hypothetical protein IH948_02840 [Bacteroidetes bacterium]|nr:hypothetical protein [Bacteroidota bacterium]